MSAVPQRYKQMMVRGTTITLVLGMLAGCSVFQAPPIPERATASTTAQPVPVGPIQLAKVSVDWQDVDVLRQPKAEAQRLSGIIYKELSRKALISEVSSDLLQVTILEVFLRSGGRVGVSTDYMAGEIKWLDGDGDSKSVFRIRASYTQRGGDPVSTEARLDKLYAKFADLTIRELITNQENPTSAGVATAL